jgi:hypothetical protein
MALRRSHDVGGTLHAEVMRIVWELDGGTVDDVRALGHGAGYPERRPWPF